VRIGCCRLSTRLQAPVGPLLASHRRRARRLRLQPRHQHRQRDAKGRGEIGRDGAWVRREQSRCSQDPTAHSRGGLIRTYSGCPQPFPSSAKSPSACAMYSGEKIRQLPRTRRTESPKWGIELIRRMRDMSERFRIQPQEGKGSTLVNTIHNSNDMCRGA